MLQKMITYPKKEIISLYCLHQSNYYRHRRQLGSHLGIDPTGSLTVRPPTSAGGVLDYTTPRWQ